MAAVFYESSIAADDLLLVMRQSSLKKPVNAENFDALKECFDALQALAFVTFRLPAVMLLLFLPMRPLFFFLLLPFSLFSQERPMYVRAHPGFSERIWNYIYTFDNDSCAHFGFNFYILTDIAQSPAPPAYRTNGIDIGVAVGEHKLNGAMLGLVFMQGDSINGFCYAPFADVWDVNGIAVSDLIGGVNSSMNGINISGLAQVNNRGNGLSISGLTCVYDSSYNGIALSGIYHRNHSVFRGMGISTVQLFQDANGLAVSGVQTVTGGNFHGVSMAGIGNVTAQNAKGFFFSGIYNWNGEDFSGVEISAITNRVRENGKGAQVSLINSCPVMQGTQVGLINWSRRMQGVQVGLLNYNGTNPKGLRLLPLVNFNFRPIVETDTLREKNDSCYVLKSYFKDGRLASVSHYCGGKLNGEFTLYNEFGDKVRTTNYVNGIKEGEEFSFDGAGRKTESTFWNADTVLWTANINFPAYYNKLFYEKEIYTAGNETMLLGMVGDDTLYFFILKDGNYVNKDEISEDDELISVYNGGKIKELIWVNYKYSWIDFNGPNEEKVLHVRDMVEKSSPLLFTVGDYGGAYEQYEFGNAIERAFSIFCDSCATVDINRVYSSGKIKSTLRITGKETRYWKDSLGTEHSWNYWYEDFMYYRRNGKTKLFMSPAGVETYYRSGKIRNRLVCDSSYVINEGGTFEYGSIFQRSDYYKNGQQARYENLDTLQTRYSSGKLKSSCIGGTVQSWYPNGNKEYEITRDSLLRYYDRQGHLLIDGRKDTVRIYGKDGALKEKIVFSGYNANLARNEALPDSVRKSAMQQLKRFNGLDQFDVIRTQYRNGEIISSDTMSGNNFFYLKNNLLYNVLLKEPVMRMDDELSEDFTPDLYWYGSNWLWSSLESPDFTRLVSPVKTPRWLRDYFWYDGFEKE